MTTLRLAEWLLARLSSNQRAAEMIGDLLELHPTRPIRLWLAILRLALALSWRWLVGLPTAAISFIWAFYPWTHFATRRITPGFQPTLIWKLALVISVASIFLWSMASLALIRYGLKSPIAYIAFILSSLTTVASMASFAPRSSYAATAAATLLIATCLFKKSLRLPLLSFLAASITVTVTCFSLGIFYIQIFVMRYGRRPDSNPIWAFGFLGIWLLSVLTGAWVLARINRNTAPYIPSELT